MGASQNGGSTIAMAAEIARRLDELEEQLHRDHDERRRLEQEVEHARSLIHAVNNALSIISTFAAVLAEEIDADDPLRESVDEIANAAQRAATATRELALPRRYPSEGGGPRRP